MVAGRDDRLTDGEVLAVARFRFALRRFELRTDAIVRECGLTPQRYLLLLAVQATQAESADASMSEIARVLGLAASTVTDLVARAVAVGLLERQASTEDGRKARIVLTPEGEVRLHTSIRRLGGERASLRRELLEASRLFPA